MAPSFRLALHRAAAARAALAARRRPPSGPGETGQAAETEEVSRPRGALLWAHFSDGARGQGGAVLLAALKADRPDLNLLLTGAAPPLDGLRTKPPLDTGALSRAFLSHWKPDVILWIGEQPAPVLWTQAQAEGIPLCAVEADPAAQHLSLVRPMKDFAFVLADRSDPRLTRAGSVLLETPGRLCTAPAPPPCNAARLAVLTRVLATRPLWLALDLAAPEIAPVLQAHRTASHLAHRLVLIVRTVDAPAAAALDAALAKGHWRAAREAEGDPIEDDTQVLVARPGLAGEDGLWYRLASISFLGCTFDAGCDGPDPWGPAALGSVVLHGPQLGSHAGTYGRLHAAGAAWRVTEGGELGRIVDRLLAPERAAGMAHAAWQVTSEGAEATDRAKELIDALLDDGCL